MAPLRRVKRPNRLVGFDDDCMPSSLSVGLQNSINAAYGHIAVPGPQYNVRKTLHHNMYGFVEADAAQRLARDPRACCVSWPRPQLESPKGAKILT